MYINFINDRKELGYEVLVDINCGIKLVLITDSAVQLIKNFPLNGKRKVKRMFLYVLFLFNLGQPLAPYAAAVVIPLPPTPIHRLYSTWNEGNKISTNKNYPQLASIPPTKVDKIRLTNEQINNLALQLNSVIVVQ
jgi:hypothetical protein